ncbi:DUF1524 domain-containing protein [Cellulomonas cellasea]|uniref:GmrSD restriction endonuclease domain-containing protein n=1 Tax=Cellulomonas cellasea TaxID=43670 RepID=UPI0025A4A94B|nr:DUF1524 domain-containing protein [Cellulomonas cellasea]MDM8083729.1 DUF1524 domain-containing protein [Cellulomonas cellasea]
MSTHVARRSWSTVAPALALALLAGPLLAGCEQVEAAPGAASAPAAAVEVETGVDAEPVPEADLAPAGEVAAAQSALAAALLLEVKGRAPKTGYSRDQFGAAWKDTDRNGCDQRNDVLGRDLTDLTHKPGTRSCVVLSGTLADPYSGTVIAFQRGQDTSSAVQIDHVVALADAWQKGAQQWDAPTREQFANDPLNLLAVDGPLNAQKGAGDTATWLPPNKAYRCAYVARQVGVKLAYGLWVTAAEQDAMASVLSACPDEPLPTGSAIPPAAAPAPATEPAPEPESAPESAPYKNCAEAWSAGAAPVRLGDPGYAPHLDGDGDGVGCERRP